MRITVAALMDQLLKCAPNAEIEFFINQKNSDPIVRNSVHRVDNLGAHHVRIFLQQSA